MTAGERGGADPTPTAETADPTPSAASASEPTSATQAAGAPTDAAPADTDNVVRLDDPKDLEIAALKAKLEEAKESQKQTTERLKAVSKAYTDIQGEIKAVKERMEQRAKFDSELQAFDQVRAFFDPVMNLKRAMSVQGDPELLRQGLDMVHHQFLEALRKLGLTEIPGVGAAFDPSIHEALGVQPVTERSLDGKVVTVHTTGFTVKGRVLQAAQVVIGKYEEAPEA